MQNIASDITCLVHHGVYIRQIITHVIIPALDLHKFLEALFFKVCYRGALKGLSRLIIGKDLLHLLLKAVLSLE